MEIAIAGIEEQRHQLGLRRETLEQSLDDIAAQVVALDDVEKILRAAVGSEAELEPSGAGDEPPPSSSPAPPLVRSTKPTPLTRKHRTQPRRERTDVDKSANVDKVVEAARKLGGRQGKGALMREANLTEYKAAAALGEAVRLGRLTRVGAAAGTRYFAEDSKAPVTPVAERKAQPSSQDDREGSLKDRQEPTLEGLIFSALQIEAMTIPALCARVGKPQVEVASALGKLQREGDVRRQVRGDAVLYRTVL